MPTTSRNNHTRLSFDKYSMYLVIRLPYVTYCRYTYFAYDRYNSTHGDLIRKNISHTGFYDDVINKFNK